MTIYFIPQDTQFLWEDITNLWEAILIDWEAMISDETAYKFYLNQSVTDLPVWKLRLTSNFGNKPVEVAGVELEWDMALLINNDRYSEWNIMSNLDQEAQLDIQGFWQYEVLGGPDSENLLSLAQGMTKVVNQSPKRLNEKPKYIGPNPNAESYIIY